MKSIRDKLCKVNNLVSEGRVVSMAILGRGRPAPGPPLYTPLTPEQGAAIERARQRIADGTERKEELKELRELAFKARNAGDEEAFQAFAKVAEAIGSGAPWETIGKLAVNLKKRHRKWAPSWILKQYTRTVEDSDMMQDKLRSLLVEIRGGMSKVDRLKQEKGYLQREYEALAREPGLLSRDERKRKADLERKIDGLHRQIKNLANEEASGHGELDVSEGHHEKLEG